MAQAIRHSGDQLMQGPNDRRRPQFWGEQYPRQDASRSHQELWESAIPHFPAGPAQGRISQSLLPLRQPRQPPSANTGGQPNRGARPSLRPGVPSPGPANRATGARRHSSQMGISREGAEALLEEEGGLWLRAYRSPEGGGTDSRDRPQGPAWGQSARGRQNQSAAGNAVLS